MKTFDGPMSAKEFKDTLAELGLSVYASGSVLGISLRQAQRYSAGDTIAAPTARHLRMLRYHIAELNEIAKTLEGE